MLKEGKNKSVNSGSPGEKHPPPPAIHSCVFLGPGWHQQVGPKGHTVRNPEGTSCGLFAKGYSGSASKRKEPKASVSASSPPSSSGHFSPHLLASHSSFFCLALPCQILEHCLGYRVSRTQSCPIQHMVVHNHPVNPLRVCEDKQQTCSLSAGIAYFMESLQLSDPSLRKWECMKNCAPSAY